MSCVTILLAFVALAKGLLANCDTDASADKLAQILTGRVIDKLFALKATTVDDGDLEQGRREEGKGGQERGTIGEESGGENATSSDLTAFHTSPRLGLSRRSLTSMPWARDKPQTGAWRMWNRFMVGNVRHFYDGHVDDTNVEEDSPLARVRSTARIPLSQDLTKTLPPDEPLELPPNVRYSSNDFLDVIFALPSSPVLGRIFNQLLFTIGWTTIYLLARQLGYMTFSLAPVPHTLLGSFLGLLLVFRTNSAYERWWEGRLLWGQIHSNCRNLALAIKAYMKPKAPNAAQKFANALISYPNAVFELCREHPGSVQKPLFVCGQMHEALAESLAEGEKKQVNTLSSQAWMFSLQLNRMNELVNNLGDLAGGLTRIVNTPLPLSYSRHTSRFLTVWCITLPFVLAPTFGWATLPIITIISWALFGIEELGHMIEQPFAYELEPQPGMHGGPAGRFDVSLPIEELAKLIREGIRLLSGY